MLVGLDAHGRDNGHKHLFGRIGMPFKMISQPDVGQ
jgi:hypothetical protein